METCCAVGDGEKYHYETTRCQRQITECQDEALRPNQLRPSPFKTNTNDNPRRHIIYRMHESRKFITLIHLFNDLFLKVCGNFTDEFEINV